MNSNKAHEIHVYCVGTDMTYSFEDCGLQLLIPLFHRSHTAFMMHTKGYYHRTFRYTSIESATGSTLYSFEICLTSVRNKTRVMAAFIRPVHNFMQHNLQHC